MAFGWLHSNGVMMARVVSAAFPLIPAVSAVNLNGQLSNNQFLHKPKQYC